MYSELLFKEILTNPKLKSDSIVVNFIRTCARRSFNIPIEPTGLNGELFVDRTIANTKFPCLQFKQSHGLKVYANRQTAKVNSDNIVTCNKRMWSIFYGNSFIRIERYPCNNYDIMFEELGYPPLFKRMFSMFFCFFFLNHSQTECSQFLAILFNAAENNNTIPIVEASKKKVRCWQRWRKVFLPSQYVFLQAFYKFFIKLQEKKMKFFREYHLQTQKMFEPNKSVCSYNMVYIIITTMNFAAYQKYFNKFGKVQAFLFAIPDPIAEQ